MPRKLRPPKGVRNATGPRGRPKRGLRKRGGEGTQNTNSDSAAERAEILRLKKELALRTEELNEATHVLRKTKSRLKKVGRKRELHGDKARVAAVASEIKGFAARILELSGEHRSLSAVKHSQAFAIRRLTDDARDYVDRYDALKQELTEIKSQMLTERKQRQAKAAEYAAVAKDESQLRQQIAVLEGQLARDQRAKTSFDSDKATSRDRTIVSSKKTQSPIKDSNSPSRAQKAEAEREEKAAKYDRRISILTHDIMKDQKRQASKVRKRRQEFEDLDEQRQAMTDQIRSLQDQLTQATKLGMTLISQIKSFKILSAHPEESDLFKVAGSSTANRRRGGSANRSVRRSKPK